MAPSGFLTRSTSSIPHNCDQTGKVWRDSGGNLRGLGNLPCYSYYSQIMGPTNWSLSTNDWAGYATAQWQPAKLAVFSAGLRWEREQLPPPIAALANPELPLTGKMPNLGNDWGPRVSLAIGNAATAGRMAGAAAGLRHVLRPHRKRHARNRAHPDRLAQWRPELLHAAHRQPE